MMGVISGMAGAAKQFVQPLSANYRCQKYPSSSYPTLPTSLSSLWSRCLTRPSSLTSRLVPMAASSTASDVQLLDNVGDVLGDVTIFKATGEPVMFKDLWDQNEGVAVVALLRHFGCVCCWEFASDLKAAKARFDAAGVKLIAVGVGGADKARMLGERLPFPMECLYADPERKAYDVLGLYYGFGRTFFNPASTKVFSRFDSLKKAMENYTIQATPDDRSGVLQQ
ncbi:hypothetical protein SOVF_126680, partial [Spinacia oleracea]